MMYKWVGGGGGMNKKGIWTEGGRVYHLKVKKNLIHSISLSITNALNYL